MVFWLTSSATKPAIFLNSQILTMHVKVDLQIAQCAHGVCALQSSSYIFICRQLTATGKGRHQLSKKKRNRTWLELKDDKNLAGYHSIP